MTDFEVISIEPQHAAVVRAELPMDELPTLFDRAFHEVIAATGELHVAVTGPPFGYYPRQPGATVEVAAGFPVATPITPHGEVTPLELPGGRVVRGVHVGSFDALRETYAELMAWVADRRLAMAGGMWETYLTDPAAEPDPATWRTEITWPLRE